MATNIKSWLGAGTALPAAVEAKFTKLPKLTTVLNKITSKVPAGPAIFPNPPASGLPILGVNKIPTPPAIFGSPLGRGQKVVQLKADLMPDRGNNSPDVNFLDRHTQAKIGGSAITFK